jgi:hypothetical protein
MSEGDPMIRWASRLALVVLASAAAWGLWLIPTSRNGSTHVWPIHSHHIILLAGLVLAWVAVGIATLIALAFLVAFLWDLAR